MNVLFFNNPGSQKNLRWKFSLFLLTLYNFSYNLNIIFKVQN